MLNEVRLIGRLGKDPELRYTQNQTAVASFSVATSERRKDQSGSWIDHTEWHNVVCFAKIAEACANHTHKGSLVHISGKIQTRKWQDKQGNDRYTTEILATDIRFLTPKSQAAEAQPQTTTTATPAQATEPQASMFKDDDIPF